MKNAEFSSATFVVHGSVVAGTVTTSDSIFSVIIHADGTGQTEQQTWASVPSESDARLHTGTEISKASPSHRRSAAVQQEQVLEAPAAGVMINLSDSSAISRSRRADTGSVVKALFLYTRRACCYIAFGLNTTSCDLTACKAPTEAKITLGVSEVNAGLANSQVSFQVQVVYKALTTGYDELYGTYDDHLNSFTYNNDGDVDEVHALRNTYYADLATLVVSDNEHCGIGWGALGYPVSAGLAFTVLNAKCVSGTFSMGHEWGHK